MMMMMMIGMMTGNGRNVGGTGGGDNTHDAYVNGGGNAMSGNGRNINADGNGGGNAARGGANDIE
jgi:hypothetical protein